MRKNQIKSAISAAVLGVLSPLAMVMPVSAATQTFVSRSDADYLTPADRGKMSADLSWVSGFGPVNGDTVEFPATATYQTITNDFTSLSLAKVVFNGEVSGTSSKSFTISGNNLTITSGIDAIMTGSGGDHSVGVGVTLGAAATFKTSGSNSLSVGGEGKTIALGTNDLTLDASGGTITLLGEITGTGKIVKSGTGKVKLMATPGTGYAGSIDVSAGEFTVDKTFGAANVVVSGGTLKGSGSVGDVTMTSGSIAPGNSPGCLNASDLAYTGGSYDVELGGKSIAACEYDNMVATGTVNLGSNTTLNVSLVNSFAPAKNDTFSIILNDSNDAVQGTFKGLADGDKFTLGGYTYQINYDAGDGNDVVLLVTGTPSAPDTGVGSLISSPMVTLIAAISVAGAVAGYRIYDMKKVRR